MKLIDLAKLVVYCPGILPAKTFDDLKLSLAMNGASIETLEELVHLYEKMDEEIDLDSFQNQTQIYTGTLNEVFKSWRGKK